VIEAHHLFALDYDRIEVVVHPQSLIHAMVRLEDGSVLAHCGPPDMRVPIGYALRHPAPPPAREPMDLVGRTIEFMAPDEETFPCLALARAAGRVGGTAPAVLNAANEVAVGAFLAGAVGFMDIPRLVEAPSRCRRRGGARHAGGGVRGRRAARRVVDRMLTGSGAWSV